MNKRHIPKFIVCQNFNEAQTFVVSTKTPILIAEVITHSNKEFELIVVNYDQSLVNVQPEKIAGLLRRMTDWYYYTIFGIQKQNL